MPSNRTRRRLLQAGAVIGAVGVAGCVDSDLDMRMPWGNGDGEDTGSGKRSSDYVIWKDESNIVSTNGRTGETAHRGIAGQDDAEIIQVTLEALEEGGEGGCVYVSPDTYELHNAIHVTASRTELVSARARFRFYDHDRIDGDREIDSDLVIHQCDDVYVSGLILDGNKEERTRRTRTIDLAESERAVFERCIVYGGRANRSGAGYGLGGPYECDHTIVHNCVFLDSDRHAIHPSTNSSELRVTNWTFRNNGWGDNDTGGSAIAGHASTDIIITNNLFDGNAHGYHSGGDQLDRVVVADNVFVDNGDSEKDQVRISEMTGSVDIRDNIFGFTEDGPIDSGAHVLIEIRDGTGGTITIDGNHFMDGEDQIVARHPADQGSLEKLFVTDNIFEGARGPIVHAEGISTELVRNNTLEPAHDGSVFSGHASVSRGLICDNVLLGGTVDEVEGREAITVEDNRIL